MKLLLNLFLNVFINGAILFLISEYFPEFGFVVNTSYSLVITFAIIGFIFWILNTFVKKILNIVSIPLKILTLGLFSFVVNILIFYILEFVVNEMNLGISIKLGSVLMVFVLSIVISLLYFIIKKII